MKTLNATLKSTDPAAGKSWPVWAEIVLTLLLGWMIFVLLTGGVPFAQAGWWAAEYESKKPFVRLMRLSVALFMVPAALIAVWRPQIQDQPRLLQSLQNFAGRHGMALAGTLALLYFFILSTVGWHRHLMLESRAFDLGIFAQAVWNTTQGHFLYSSLKEGICLLGDHMSPILAALAPLYKLWPDPRLLVLVQAAATAANLPLIAWIARHKTGSSALGVLFAVLYFFYHPSRGVLHEDFHPEVLAEPFMLLAFIFLERRKIPAFLICLAVIASAKENMLGIVFILGAYAAIFRQMRLLGAVIMAASIALFVWEVRWLIPQISGKPYLYQGFYRHLQTGPWHTLVSTLLNAENLEYVSKLFFPFIFLPFLHPPALMLTLPILAQNLLSNNPVFRSLTYHYTAGLTPFVFIAAVYGLANALRWAGGRQSLKNLIVGGLLLTALLRSGPAEYFYYWQSSRHDTPHRTQVRTALAALPAQASVLTHNNLLPHVANRRNIFQFDHNGSPTKGETARKYGVDFVVFDTAFWEPGTLGAEETAAELQTLGYSVEYRLGTLTILKRRDYNE